MNQFYYDTKKTLFLVTFFAKPPVKFYERINTCPFYSSAKQDFEYGTAMLLETSNLRSLSVKHRLSKIDKLSYCFNEARVLIMIEFL